MDPLSKTQDTFNNEGSKGVLGKQKYHSGLYRFALGLRVGITAGETETQISRT